MSTVAVIGGGAAGIGAARTLMGEGLDVVLIESAPRLGGNCMGVEVRGDDGSSFTIDAGVSDFNRTTFVEFSRLVDELGLPTRPIGTDTSFATVAGRTVASCRQGRWSFGNGIDGDDLPGEIERFRLRATEVLEDARFANWTVGRYLDHFGASRTFRDLYLLPRAVGCFPMPDRRPEDLPVRGLIEFWRIHGVVSRAVADRHCIVGGMHRYPDVFAAWFRAQGGRLLCGSRVLEIARRRDGVEVRIVDCDDRHRRVHVDHVVLTNHARDVLPLLDAPTEPEEAALGRFARQRARVVVHRDLRLAGHDRDALGAFHYVIPSGDLPRVRPTMTFVPKHLAGLPAAAPDVYVTMNPHREPAPDSIVTERFFLHPVFDPSHGAAVAQLHRLQGCHRTWYAGAWLCSPFVHESAMLSGIRAAERLLRASGTRRRTVALAIA